MCRHKVKQLEFMYLGTHTKLGGFFALFHTNKNVNKLFSLIVRTLGNLSNEVCNEIGMHCLYLSSFHGLSPPPHPFILLVYIPNYAKKLHVLEWRTPFFKCNMRSGSM